MHLKRVTFHADGNVTQKGILCYIIVLNKKGIFGFNALQLYIFQLMESAYCDDVATWWKISVFSPLLALCTLIEEKERGPT